MTTRFREGTVFLTVKPGRYSMELSVVKATNAKPRATPTGSIVVKIKLRVPASAFQPLEPALDVTIPEEMVRIPAVDAEPEDANENGES